MANQTKKAVDALKGGRVWGSAVRSSGGGKSPLTDAVKEEKKKNTNKRGGKERGLTASSFIVRKKKI